MAKKDDAEYGYECLGLVFQFGEMNASHLQQLQLCLPGLIPDYGVVSRSIWDADPIPADTVLTMIQYVSGGKSWNPRYVAYARAHGKRPEDMLEADKITYPGGCMCGFILWVQRNLVAFRVLHPEAFIGFHVSDQDAWTAWLDDRADRAAVALAEAQGPACCRVEPGAVVFLCGPKITCTDGGEHQMDGMERFEGPNEASRGWTAVCSKCGHRAIDEAAWM